MAAIATEGRLFGIDYSMGSVDASRATNAKLIRTGRVEIRQAAVSQLPFPDATFDLVTAVETHYYWPDLPKDMQEVRRVVKPGGMLILIAESYKGGRHDLVQGLAMIALRAARLSAEEHRELFAAAGFADVQVFEDRNRGWICVTGRRPEVTARIPTLATPGEGVALYTFPVATKNAAFRTSVLFAYKLNWQTVFYVGYGDDRAFEEDRDRLVPNTRQVFAKLSYAVQR